MIRQFLLIFLTITIGNITFASDYDAEDRVFVSKVRKNYENYSAGSYGQFDGVRTIVRLDVKVKEHRLDGDIKRVGFIGTVHEKYPFSIVQNLEDQTQSSTWTFDFTIRARVFGDVDHFYKGAFFVETVYETFYWLRNSDGSDIEISPRIYY